MYMKTLVAWACGVALFLFGLVTSTSAHAILLESKPAAQDHISGSKVPVLLRFNCRIDHDRSRLTLVLPDSSSQPLMLKKESPEDALTADIPSLKPGEYSLHWLVLASDGHITQGVIPFKVDRPLTSQ
jgi:copper resistance protein C